MSYVYVLQMRIPDYPFHPIKVGFSHEPQRRIQSFTHGPFPTALVFQWRGTRKDEHAFHVRFRHYRLYGEWFYPSSDITDWLSDRSGYEVALTPKSDAGKKVEAFERRFRGMFAEEPQSPQLPDPYEFPFTPDYEHAVANYISDLDSQWPRVGNRRCLVKRQHVAEMTGLSEHDIRQYMDYLKLGGVVRYSIECVEKFLQSYPQFLNGIKRLT